MACALSYKRLNQTGTSAPLSSNDAVRSQHIMNQESSKNQSLFICKLCYSNSSFYSKYPQAALDHRHFDMGTDTLTLQIGPKSWTNEGTELHTWTVGHVLVSNMNTRTPVTYSARIRLCTYSPPSSPTPPYWEFLVLKEEAVEAK